MPTVKLQPIAEWARGASVILEFDRTTTIALISQLQLAFRHPNNMGPGRVVLESFVHELIERLDPDHGDVYRY